VLGKLLLSIVSYIVPYLILGLVLGIELVLSIELVLDLGLGSLSILFIVEYQFFWYTYIICLSLCLVWGGIVLGINSWGLADIPDP